MKRVVLLSLFIILPYEGFSQYGTYLFAAIYKDGIIMGTDSRKVFFDDTKTEVIAYFEGNNKILTYGNKYLFAIAGLYRAGDQQFEELFMEFEKQNKGLTISTFYERLILFLSKKLPKEVFRRIAQKNQFMICGYDKGVPTIVFYSKGHGEVVKNIGYKTNNPIDNNFPGLASMYSGLTKERAVPIVHKFILDVAKGRNLRKQSTVGGQPNVAIVNQSGIEFAYKQTLGYSTQKALTSAIFRGKVPMWYRSTRDSIYIANLFKADFLRLSKTPLR